MRLPLFVAAATLPLTSALVIQNIQDVLSDIKDLEDELFHPTLNPNTQKTQNALNHALEHSPTFTPAEALDASHDSAKFPDLIKSFESLTTYIKILFGNSIDEITNGPSTLVPLVLENTVTTQPSTSDKTIYQLISESKYTTILTKIINEDEELVQFLNSTEHNKITIFAPTDDAFQKIPHRKHGRHDHDRDHDGDGYDTSDGEWWNQDSHIPKKIIRALARYHSSPFVLNAAKLFHRHTIPSALHDPLLGSRPDGDDGNDDDGGDHEHGHGGLPQRIAVRAGFKGLTLNFYSHIVAADIGATNGLIHGIDNILLPPPSASLLLDILPTKFSTFNLGLHKTGLEEYLNTTAESKGDGFTLFTPSNSAFSHLGLKINAFLFSPPGLPYLKALLKYHIVPGETLYSDVLYKDREIKPFDLGPGLGTRGDVDEDGFVHLDLPTLLGGEHKIAVDVAHYGPYVSFKLNGGQRVGFADVLARDGVIHVLNHVLIPPRRLGGFIVEEDLEGGELELEDLVERLRPYVEDLGEGVDDFDHVADL
ncbi:FAS1 domain-containing protein [Aspergillus undulatus]|uniref:FAS1 domain-containing protein n=1 Tax=Aspergillus undulatus TaxID=1810928 RepID=UPI003CCDA285